MIGEIAFQVFGAKWSGIRLLSGAIARNPDCIVQADGSFAPFLTGKMDTPAEGEHDLEKRTKLRIDNFQKACCHKAGETPQRKWGHQTIAEDVGRQHGRLERHRLDDRAGQRLEVRRAHVQVGDRVEQVWVVADRLDPDAVETALSAWVAAQLAARAAGAQVVDTGIPERERRRVWALDGKTLRGARDDHGLRHAHHDRDRPRRPGPRWPSRRWSTPEQRSRRAQSS